MNFSNNFGGDTFEGLFLDIREGWKEWVHQLHQSRMPKSTEDVEAQPKTEEPDSSRQKATRIYEGLKPKSLQPKPAAPETGAGDGNVQHALPTKETQQGSDMCYYFSFLDRAASYGRADLIEHLLNGDTATNIIKKAMSANPTDARTKYLGSLSESRFKVAVKEILGTAIPEGRKRNGNAMHRATMNNASGAIRALKRCLKDEEVKGMLEERFGDEVPVHIASASGFVESVEAFVEVGGPGVLEILDGKRGWTAMHYAA